MRSNCRVDGCERVSVARGVCSAHHKRLMRHGDPTAGRKSPNDVLVVQPTVVTYSAAHYRVRAALGKASDHRCPCGDAAAEWSYVGGAERELVEDGQPYSLDIGDYEALCHSCHIKRDWKGPRGWARR